MEKKTQTKKIDIKTAKGTPLTLTLTLTLETKHHEASAGDAWEGIAGREAYDEVREYHSVIVEGAGKRVKCNPRRDTRPNRPTTGAWIDMQAADLDTGKPTSYAFAAPDLDLDAEWASMRAELDAPAAEKTAEAAETEKNVAEAILAVPQHLVFASAEAEAEYTKNYADAWNDGGDGYMPSTTTADRVAWAQNVIGTPTTLAKLIDNWGANCFVIEYRGTNSDGPIVLWADEDVYGATAIAKYGDLIVTPCNPRKIDGYHDAATYQSAWHQVNDDDNAMYPMEFRVVA
jgi:hypothetical protein